MNSATTFGSDSTLPARRLYLIRAVVAPVWAVLLVVALPAGGSLTPDEAVPALAVALLILYPVIDVTASLIDARSARRTAPRNSVAQLVNAGVSVAATAAMAVAAGHGADAMLSVFGIWAVLTGVIQLALGVRRRRRGTPGQLPMILSGSISGLVGLAFAFMATRAEINVVGVAGYAAAGAVFFLVSAWRQRATTSVESANTRVSA